MASSSSNALILPPQPAGGTNLLDIRAIKGPVHIPNSYAWIGWTLLALALALLAAYLWRKFRVRKKSGAPIVVIPPHRKAKDRLRTASELMSDPYAFCSLVSGVVRTYVEERFDLHAPDRTTEEFLEELRTSTALKGEHKALLQDFLGRCDLVKFARFEPRQDELQQLLDSALRFIDETAPVAAPAEQKAA